MHDQWIGLIATRLGRVVFLEEPLLFYRRHGGNVSGGKTSWKTETGLDRFSFVCMEGKTIRLSA